MSSTPPDPRNTHKPSSATLRPLTRLSSAMFETPAVLKRTTTAGRKLAELKGLAASMPNQGILINTLGLQEAKDSSAIENIVTTHDELFRSATYPNLAASPAAKEVRHYVHALRTGYDLVRQHGLMTANDMLSVQAELEQSNAGFRRLPGTTLKDGLGRIVYTPPQDHSEIVELMSDLERFINDDAAFEADPLIKMAIIHHQFESIHPFYDGNGRTGRIVNVLYLVNKALLDIPMLYLSSHIVRSKPDYYRLLQAVRDSGDAPAVWEEFINNLFMHPYTKIDFVERDLKVSRLTATKYLDALAKAGFVEKVKVARSNYYINVALNSILTRTGE